jgi:hypothetical protein
VKIDSVAPSLTTASARDMIEAMTAGERDLAVLARLPAGVMRRKIPELEMACDGGLPLVAWRHRLKGDGDGRDTQEVRR